jgi:copper chaperone CopZ
MPGVSFEHMNSHSYVLLNNFKSPNIRRTKMKKTYKIDVDCANCANKMEEAAKNTSGIKDASVNFMTLKMKVEFDESADADTVMKEVLKNCKKVERDCEIYI